MNLTSAIVLIISISFWISRLRGGCTWHHVRIESNSRDTDCRNTIGSFQYAHRLNYTGDGLFCREIVFLPNIQGACSGTSCLRLNELDHWKLVRSGKFRVLAEDQSSYLIANMERYYSLTLMAIARPSIHHKPTCHHCQGRPMLPVRNSFSPFQNMGEDIVSTAPSLSYRVGITGIENHVKSPPADWTDKPCRCLCNMQNKGTVICAPDNRSFQATISAKYVMWHLWMSVDVSGHQNHADAPPYGSTVSFLFKNQSQ